MSLDVMNKQQINALMDLIGAIQNFTQHCYNKKGEWKGTVNIPLLTMEAMTLQEAVQHYIEVITNES